MNYIEFNQWIATLGWTLVHSLWQGLIIALLYVIAQSLITRTRSAERYALSAGAMALMLFSSVATFFYLRSVSAAAPLTHSALTAQAATTRPADVRAPLAFFETWRAWIDVHLDLVVFIWLAGVVVLSLRLSIAWFYSIRLRQRALPVSGHWDERLQHLAADLTIAGKIILAQCTAVRSPMVLGYLKPVILLPVGMLSGLSTEQVESILLHELAHIRRHDYLVNLLQSMMEVIFFFNPFVKIVSARMRTEREESCDDIVVRFKDPLAYARALHQLEETRVWNAGIGMAATGTKNKLMQRIKRIMKTTERKDEGTRKVVPALLVIALLIGGSWLSVQAHRAEEDESGFMPAATVASDTSIKGKSPQGKRYYFTPKNTDGNNEAPAISGVTPGSAVIINSQLPTPAEGDLTLSLPLPPMGPFMLAPGPMIFPGDTILPGTVTLGSGMRMEEFNKQFTEQFKAKFGDFYKKNGKELEKMLEGLSAQMQMQLAETEIPAQALAELAHFNQGVPLRELREMQRDELRAHELAVRELRIAADDERAAAPARARAESFAELAEQNAASEADNLDKITDPGNPLARPLRDALVHDHYLTNGEEIKSVNWNDNEITINSKKITEKDAPRYNNLLRRFVEEKSQSHHKAVELREKARAKTPRSRVGAVE